MTETFKQKTDFGVSVIICCYNSASRLPETLKHLARQAVPAATPWEIILVNNASTDDTAEIALTLWREAGNPVELRVMDELKPGLSHAREAGIANARYNLVIFVDDDNWLDANYVATAHDIMQQRPQVGVIGACITAQFGAQPPSWFKQMQSYYAIGPQGPLEGDITDIQPHVAGAGMVLRKSAYRELKRWEFKPLQMGRQGVVLTSGEDYEICYALALIGYRIWYDSRLQLVHFLPAQRLTRAYLLKLAGGIRQTEAILTCYETAFQRSDDSPFMIYLRAVRTHGEWALRSVVKFLLGHRDWMVCYLELLGLWHTLVSLPELHRVFRLHYPEILKLKQGVAAK